MKKQLLFAAALFMGLFANAGTPSTRNCGTMDNLQRLKTEDPGLQARMQQIETATNAFIAANQGQNTTNAIVTIPVVFHVVYSSTAQNISDAQCQAQLDQLNLDYARLNADRTNTPSVWQGISANTNIQFCMAQRDPNGAATTGIERRSTTVTSFSTNDNIKRTANGGMNAWPAGSYLNIWTGNLGGGLLGYAQFPGGSAATDGVVLLYSSVGSVAHPGTATPYHLGRTATHEVGHWLNLYHIWGDESACSGSDNVGDTPNQGPENYGCPAFPHTDACATTSPGVMFMNYMDYTDDGCMNMFTAGQSSRMNALFAVGGARYSILSSMGCVPPSGATCGVPTGLSSTVATTTANLSWMAVSGATSYSIQYKLSSSSTWTTTTSSTNSKTLSGLTSASTYNWQVSATCASGVSSYSAAANFTTASATGCGTVTGLVSSAITTTGATLSWTAVSGATSYNVQYKLNSSVTWTTTTSTTTSKTLSGLTSASLYNWHVQAVCASGSGAYSATANFTTASTACSDQYESNNSSSTAKTIPLNTDISALISTSTDIDWFVFTTVSPNTKIKIALTNLAGDYDIRLYNSSLTLLATSQNAGTTAESIIRNSTTAATYYVRVYGYNGASSATQCYKLRVNTSSVNFKLAEDGADLSVDNPAVNELVVYPNPAHDVINGAFNSAAEETIDLRLFDMMGRTIQAQQMNVTEGQNKFSFDLNDLSNGIYFVEMNNSSGRIVKKFIIEK